MRRCGTRDTSIFFGFWFWSGLYSCSQFSSVSSIMASNSAFSVPGNEGLAKRISDGKLKVVVVKIGGSSITNKAVKESVDQESLDWFARIVSETICKRFKASDETDEEGCISSTTYNRTNKRLKQQQEQEQVMLENKKERSHSETAFIIIHGAGSFGHQSAKAYGLSGQTQEPDNLKSMSITQNKRRKRGLSETRLSVQRLNHLVVSTLVDLSINAVCISPFGVPGLEAHAHLQEEPINALENLIWRTLDAGLVPVLHGDACLYGQDVGILSGDTIMEILGGLPWVSDAIFITDVDGVFNEDPRANPNAKLLKRISVDSKTADIKVDLNASGSSHEHDVTGGLKTKLEAAAKIARLKDVLIVERGSLSAEQALRGEKELELGTLLSPL